MVSQVIYNGYVGYPVSIVTEGALRTPMEIYHGSGKADDPNQCDSTENPDGNLSPHRTNIVRQVPGSTESAGGNLSPVREWRFSGDRGSTESTAKFLRGLQNGSQSRHALGCNALGRTLERCGAGCPRLTNRTSYEPLSDPALRSIPPNQNWG